MRAPWSDVRLLFVLARGQGMMRGLSAGRVGSEMNIMGSETGDVSCPNCGYDQRGNADAVVCPECGFVSEGELFEFGHVRFRWFVPLFLVGCVASIVLHQTGAHEWLSLGAGVFTVGVILWDTLAKRLRPKGQILINTAGFRVMNAASPRGRWVTWDQVVAVNDPGFPNCLFIGVKDPNPSMIEVGPMKSAKQVDEIRSVIARHHPARAGG